MDVEDRESPFDVVSDGCGELVIHSSSDENSEGEYKLLLIDIEQNAAYRLYFQSPKMPFSF